MSAFEKYSIDLRIDLDLVAPEREVATDRAIKAW